MNRPSSRVLAVQGKSLIALAATAAFLFACAPQADGGPDAWTLQQVVDGDTLRVSSRGDSTLVRIVGIDAPEKRHPQRLPEYLAAEARERLEELVSGGSIELIRNSRGDEEDRYGRLLRYVQVPGQGDPSETLLREGLVRVFDRFPHDRLERYRALEREAREAGRGLWADGGLAELRWRLDGRSPDLRVVPVGGADFAVVCEGYAISGLSGDRLLDALWAARRAGAAWGRGEKNEAERELTKAGFRPLGRGPGTSRSAR